MLFYLNDTATPGISTYIPTLSLHDALPVALFQGWTDSWLGAPSMAWLFIKAIFYAFCFLWFRATFPRYRYDQIMRLGWKVFIPITIVWILVVAFAGHANWFVVGG